MKTVPKVHNIFGIRRNTGIGQNHKDYKTLCNLNSLYILGEAKYQSDQSSYVSSLRDKHQESRHLVHSPSIDAYKLFLETRNSSQKSRNKTKVFSKVLSKMSSRMAEVQKPTATQDVTLPNLQEGINDKSDQSTAVYSPNRIIPEWGIVKIQTDMMIFFIFLLVIVYQFSYWLYTEKIELPHNVRASFYFDGSWYPNI